MRVRVCVCECVCVCVSVSVCVCVCVSVRVCVSLSLVLSPGSDPGFGVHLQAAAPQAVFLRGFGQESSLGCQLLGHGTDVVRLEPAAAADVTDPRLIGLSGVMLHVPAREDPRLQS